MNFSSTAKLQKCVGSCSGISVNVMSGGALGQCRRCSDNSSDTHGAGPWPEPRVGGLNCTEGYGEEGNTLYCVV